MISCPLEVVERCEKSQSSTFIHDFVSINIVRDEKNLIISRLTRNYWSYYSNRSGNFGCNWTLFHSPQKRKVKMMMSAESRNWILFLCINTWWRFIESNCLNWLSSHLWIINIISINKSVCFDNTYDDDDIFLMRRLARLLMFVSPLFSNAFSGTCNKHKY